MLCLVLFYPTLYLNDLIDSVASTCVLSKKEGGLSVWLQEQYTEIQSCNLGYFLSANQSGRESNLKIKKWNLQEKTEVSYLSPGLVLAVSCRVCGDCEGAPICLSWPSFTDWRGKLDEGMMNGVREVDWVSIVPSVALLVGVLNTLLFPTRVVSVFGTAVWTPFCLQPSLVPLAVWHCFARVPCWKLYIMTFFWCFEWIEKLLQCY